MTSKNISVHTHTNICKEIENRLEKMYTTLLTVFTSGGENGILAERKPLNSYPHIVEKFNHDNLVIHRLSKKSFSYIILDLCVILAYFRDTFPFE